MKKILLSAVMLGVTLTAFSQNVGSYADIQNSKKGDLDEYTAMDGFTYKPGDTLTIGKPVNEKAFAFMYSQEMNGQIPVGITFSNAKIIAKKIYVSGSEKRGFKSYVRAKAQCSLCGYFVVSLDDAIQSGELVAKGLTKETAIKKLKEQKELLELGVITSEEFEKKKAELIKFIK
jgi:hypothetical protein